MASCIAALLLASLFTVIQPAAPSIAASGSDFQPGNIIDDSVFFDPNTMTVAQIQSFLNAKVPTCTSGYTCLKSYRQDTKTRYADPMCAKYTGALNESAATIIYKVAHACSINPKVIITTLQKEQGLVTSTHPSSAIYRKAMGFGCPDTSVCDSTYYGYFNQVYSGAWAFQRYTMPAGTGAGTAWYSNYSKYGVGGTTSILYNPNAGCGTKSVYIENRATGSLYTYTPYTPNAAALSTGYGIGDSCSSYGNRNFFYYYTDWFGSTHGKGSMIRASGQAAIYLVVGAKKYHVPNVTVLNIFSALGPVRVVSQAYVDTFSTGMDLSPAVLDPQTGIVGLVQDGKRHAITTCARAAAWGFPCGTYASISPSQAALLPLGQGVTDFHTLAGSSKIYKVDGTVSSPVDGAAYAATLNGGKAPYAAVMTAAAAAKFSPGPLLMSPPAAVGTLIKKSDKPDLFLVDGARKIMSRTGVADALGAKVAATLSPTRVDGYATAAAGLTAVVSCDAVPYFGADGTLYKIDPAAKTGLGVTTLDATTCGTYKKSSAPALAAIWLKSTTAPEVYQIVDGKRRWAPDKATYDALRNGSTPLMIGARQMASIPLGAPFWSAANAAPATLVKKTGQTELYFVDGIARKIHLPSWGVGDALGLKGYTVLGGSTVDGLPTALGELTQVVTCAGVPYFGAAGTLHKIDPAVKHGLGTTALEATTCSALKRSTAPAAKTLWIRASWTSSVYEVVDARRHLIPDWTTFTARGGSTAGLLVIGARQMATIPVGTPIPSQAK